MPTYIAKLEENKYVEWSTIVDAPITYILTREEMLSHLDEEFGKSSFDENRRRLDRADKSGTSSQFGMGVKELIAHNRAGEGEKHLGLEAILENYDSKKASEKYDEKPK